ncbi:MAG: hypothetical protein WC107_06870 [Patescibacteria group bacterium]
MAEKEKKEEQKGRGWHGDSAGHAKAGQMGGKARANKKNKGNKQ